MKILNEFALVWNEFIYIIFIEWICINLNEFIYINFNWMQLNLIWSQFKFLNWSELDQTLIIIINFNSCYKPMFYFQFCDVAKVTMIPWAELAKFG
jgi:hypothetical protein